MKHLIFKLTMPNPPSWNGKWSGENENHTLARSFSDEEFSNLPKNIIGNHFYRWNDGSTACVNVKEVPNENARKRALKGTVGFIGYQWMIDELIKYGEIRNEP